MAIYDASIQGGQGHYLQVETDHINVVYLPEDEQTDFFSFKEVAAGLGGMGEGLRGIASMDINHMACHVLQANGKGIVFQGDLLRAHDRGLFHEIGGAPRCWLFSGYLCQPLSRQGDQRGEADERADVFKAVIRMAWEQQVGGLMPECVQAALQADYVQKVEAGMESQHEH